MSYRLTITREGGYLHAVVSGTNSRENVASYLREIHNACVSRDCFRVLIEERLEGPRLGTLDVFDIAAEGSDRARGKVKAIAYVDANATGHLMQFAETVATNRGLIVRVFTSVDDAKQWLVEEQRRDDEGR